MGDGCRRLKKGEKYLRTTGVIVLVRLLTHSRHESTVLNLHRTNSDGISHDGDNNIISPG